MAAKSAKKPKNAASRSENEIAKTASTAMSPTHGNPNATNPDQEEILSSPRAFAFLATPSFHSQKTSRGFAY
jgi:hypothetical protein